MVWFEEEFLTFFKELAANNDREWFHANKKRYEKFVKEPFYNFVTHILLRLREDDPTIISDAKEAIFRIHRDVRFSKDKSPYKLFVSAVISPMGRKDHKAPGIYFELNPEAFRFYAGLYLAEKDTLYAVRERITSEPDEFAGIYKDKNFVSCFGEIRGEKQKRVPKEFKEAAEKEPLIFNKQFYVMAEKKADVIIQPGLDDIIMEYYFASKKMNQWLRETVASD